MSTHPSVRVLAPGLLGLAIVLAAGWYLVLPLFLRTRVDEAGPLSAEAVRTREPAPMQTAVADRTVHRMDEAMPAVASAAPVLIARGDFYNVVHEGRGRAEVFTLPDGSSLLRLEDFDVLNGPDLHVWLVPAATIAPTIGQELPGYVDLGKLKGNQGSQNYAIPATVDVVQFHSVVIWCQPFRVPFAAAPLG